MAAYEGFCNHVGCRTHLAPLPHPSRNRESLRIRVLRRKIRKRQVQQYLDFVQTLDHHSLLFTSYGFNTSSVNPH